MSLHDDAVAVLSVWDAPSRPQSALRHRFLAALRDSSDAVFRTHRPEHLTASALVVDADGQRACLVLHRKAGLWLQSGGHLESGDSSVAGAALREAREETGIDDLRIDPTPVRLSRHAVPFCGGAQAHHLDVQFVAVAAPGAVAQVSEESDAVGWFGLADAPEPTDDEVRALMSSASSRLRGIPAP